MDKKKKTGFLRKISKVENKISKVHLRKIKLEPGRNKLFRGRNESERVVDHMSNLSIKLEQKRIWERGSPFSELCMREEKEREKKEIQTSLFDLWSSFGRAKNESSSTRRGLRMGIENTGFRRGLKQGVQKIKGFGFRKCPRDFLEFLLRSKR